VSTARFLEAPYRGGRKAVKPRAFTATVPGSSAHSKSGVLAAPGDHDQVDAAHRVREVGEPAGRVVVGRVDFCDVGAANVLADGGQSVGPAGRQPRSYSPDSSLTRARPMPEEAPTMMALGTRAGLAAGALRTRWTGPAVSGRD
jgi:hypothetical protein